jgi:arabinofuranosyltransferase
LKEPYHLKFPGILLLLVAVVLLLYGVKTFWWEGAIDDAYITFRYSQNLVDGLGPVYNPGERLEGYSNPSWMLAMAASIALGVAPVLTAKVLGVLAAIGLLIVLYRGLLLAQVSAVVAGLATLGLATAATLHVASVSGLETVPYSLLLFCGCVSLVGSAPCRRNVLIASCCLAGAALTRPEGVVFWGLGLLAVVFWGSQPSDKTFGARKARILVFAYPGVLIAVHWIWRVVYYGDFFPNTYYAKTGGGAAMVRVGLRELGEYVSNPAHLIWVVLALIGVLVSVRRRALRRQVALMGAVVLVQLVYTLGVGGDYIFIHRFYVPLLAPLFFLFALNFSPATRPDRSTMVWLRQAVTLAAIVALPLSVWYSASRYQPVYERLTSYLAGNIKLGRFLAEYRDTDVWIATAAAGAIPYYSGLRTIDIFGLNDAHIARLPFPDIQRAGLMKWDAEYIVSRQPEIIVINRGYVPPGDPRAEAIVHSPAPLVSHLMDRQLFQQVLDDGGYTAKGLNLGDGSQFWIFERE